MAYRVLIVDDSKFFRTRLTSIVSEHPELEVAGVAENGFQAIEKARSLKPDVITMDYEMPQMDGIIAVREILKEICIPIVMFSSITQEGAKITLNALEAGAVDFLLKNFTDVSNNSDLLKQNLCKKLLGVAKKAQPTQCGMSFAGSQSHFSSEKSRVLPSSRSDHLGSSNDSILPGTISNPISKKINSVSSSDNLSQEHFNLKGRVKILVIGASTGGPVAVSDIIKQLPNNFPIPVVVAQHMPKEFTQAFSERLNKQSALNVSLAKDGDGVRAGNVYIAPGGKQLMFDQSGARLKIIDGDDRVTYKPCIDITFASAAKHFNRQVLAIVLTGMGSDGCEGARLLKQQTSHVWSQDEFSCVVYGMPAAVAKAGLSDAVLSLKDIPAQLVNSLI